MAVPESKSSPAGIAETVEEMGILLEKMGYAPVPGRLLSYLLVADPPYRDFYDILAFLNASKSTVSNTLNLLMNQGVVKYLTFNGDRKRYFQVNPDGLYRIIKEQHRRGKEVNELVGKLLKTRSKSASADFNRELKAVVDFSAYLHKGIEKLIKDWEKTHP